MGFREDGDSYQIEGLIKRYEGMFGYGFMGIDEPMKKTAIRHDG